MNDIIPTSANELPTVTLPTACLPTACLPTVARVPVSIRLATEADIGWIDRMQKAHSRELGFLQRAALLGKIKLGEVVVAEATVESAVESRESRVERGESVESRELRVEREDWEGTHPGPHPNPLPGGEGGRVESAVESRESRVEREDSAHSRLSTLDSRLTPRLTPVGYLIASDRYFKRDEVGYVTQINIAPEYRRSLVAGQLLQYQFDRSAYGCKLYSCWCAQDLAANEFWEAMGFSAIAFRSGADKKGKVVNGKRQPRVHIFWQKRIRANDTTTPWWYPSSTTGGEMRADRLVFPIMPGVGWREMEIVESGESVERGGESVESRELRVESKGEAERDLSSLSTPSSSLSTLNSQLSTPRSRLSTQAKGKNAAAEETKEIDGKLYRKVIHPPPKNGGMWFPEDLEEWVLVEKVEKPVKVKKEKPKVKIDPGMKRLARQLRDQWQERAEEIVPQVVAKHDVKRIAVVPVANYPTIKRLDAA